MSLIHFKIKRQNTPQDHSYWEHCVLPFSEGMTVASALRDLRLRPVNANGKAIAPVVWNDLCLGKKTNCACAMLINKKLTLACQHVISKPGAYLILQPSPHFPVLRDLCVDETLLENHLRQAKDWPVVDGFFDPTPFVPLKVMAPPQKEDQQKPPLKLLKRFFI